MVAFYAFNSYIYEQKQAPAASDYKQVEFTIDGMPAMVGQNGVAYFGNEIRADLDNDGEEDDMAFLVTSQPGGSGTFYYVVAAVKTDRGYVGSDAYYLGDRIAPQATTGSEDPSHVNVIAVYWAERAAGEPMTATPSVGNGVLLKLDPASMQWGIVVQGFEGETAEPEVY